MLSMAQGLAPDAGNAVVVMRGAGNDFGSAQSLKDGAKGVAAAGTQSGTPASLPSASSANAVDGKAIEISLKKLLDSGDPKYNVTIYPGDIIKVKAAGIVYVVGDVMRPGGFPIQDNEHMTVLQAIALGQGIGPDAQKNKTKIIRVAENGQQIELPVRLNDVLSGKIPDPVLQPKDVLFIPKNGASAAGKAALKTVSQWLVWRAIP
jgi:polysaccharide export outer membrane protein